MKQVCLIVKTNIKGELLTWKTTHRCHKIVILQSEFNFITSGVCWNYYVGQQTEGSTVLFRNMCLLYITLQFSAGDTKEPAPLLFEGGSSIAFKEDLL